MATADPSFHVEEYKQIRSECASLLARVESLFRYALIVSATVYAWLVARAITRLWQKFKTGQ